MDNDTSQKRYESVYSTKVRAGKRRTYFFDVRRTKGEDFYITLTESTKKFNGDGYERHKIFLYKEDFNRFLNSLSDAIDHVKTDLMPEYDYDEFTRRQDEWETRRAQEDAAAAAASMHSNSNEEQETSPTVEDTTSHEPVETHESDTEDVVETTPEMADEVGTPNPEDETIEEDMSW